MKLYLIRHAEAAPKSIDENRSLTPDGVQAAQTLGKGLRQLGMRVGAIWHSPKPRSLQTAEIIASALGSRRKLQRRTEINPDSPIRPVIKLIQKTGQNLMIVGHQPFLGELACQLLGGDISPAILNLDKPSALCLNHNRTLGWQIDWMINPDLASSLAAAAKNPRN